MSRSDEGSRRCARESAARRIDHSVRGLRGGRGYGLLGRPSFRSSRRDYEGIRWVRGSEAGEIGIHGVFVLVAHCARVVGSLGVG